MRLLVGSAASWLCQQRSVGGNIRSLVDYHVLHCGSATRSQQGETSDHQQTTVCCIVALPLKVNRGRCQIIGSLPRAVLWLCHQSPFWEISDHWQASMCCIMALPLEVSRGRYQIIGSLPCAALWLCHQSPQGEIRSLVGYHVLHYGSAIKSPQRHRGRCQSLVGYHVLHCGSVIRGPWGRYQITGRLP